MRRLRVALLLLVVGAVALFIVLPILNRTIISEFSTMYELLAEDPYSGAASADEALVELNFLIGICQIVGSLLVFSGLLIFCVSPSKTAAVSH